MLFCAAYLGDKNTKVSLPPGLYNTRREGMLLKWIFTVNTMSDLGSVLRFHSCAPDNSKYVKHTSLAYLSTLQEVETQTRHFGAGIITEELSYQNNHNRWIFRSHISLRYNYIWSFVWDKLLNPCKYQARFWCLLLVEARNSVIADHISCGVIHGTSSENKLHTNFQATENI